MSLLSAVTAFGFILFTFVLLTNTGWLGMTLLNLALDTSRDTRHERARGTVAKLLISIAAEVVMLAIAATMINHYWSSLGV